MAIPLSATLSLQDNMSATFRDITQAATENIDRFMSLSKQCENLKNKLHQLEDIHGDSIVGTQFFQDGLEAVTQMEQELYNFDETVSKTTDDVIDSVNEASEAVQDSGDESKDVHDKWNENIKSTEAAYNKLASVIRKIIGVYSIKQIVSLSDKMVQTNARLSMLGDNINVQELGEKIYSSAQRSRVGYMDMAETVAKLGMQAKEAFSSTDEIIAFNEGLNKLFTVSGMDASSISSVMYNLTQSMSTGHLLGNDYRILKMNAPKIVQLLKETYADGSQEALDQMVRNGEISASMLKNAVLGNMDEINEAFNKMPMTWGQVWTRIVNTVIKVSQPLLSLINAIAQHWNVIGPIVYGIAAAVAAYTAALLINKAVLGAHRIATTLSTIAAVAHGTAEIAEAAATTGMTQAQLAFNAALYACPLTWILLAIIAIIAIIYVVIGLINEVTGSTISATGIIMGILFTLAAFIFNVVIRPIYNGIALLVNTLANAFKDPIGSIKIMFLELSEHIVGILNGIAEKIDWLFGSNFSSTTSSWMDALSATKDKIKKDMGYEEVMQELGEWDYADAWNSGYNFGEGIEKGIGGAFDNALDAYTGSDGAGGDALKTTNTGDLLSEDDTKLLLQIATRDYKLNYQQITPEIVMNFGDIRETADVNDITDALADKLEEIYVSNLEVTA